MANSEEMLKELAYQTMTNIDHRILFERQVDLMAIATDPIISSRDSTPQQITKKLIEYRNICKTYISLSFFNLDRIRIADTTGMDIGKKDFHYNYWNDVLQGKLSVGSDIELSQTLNLPVIFFASPVKDKNNQIFGVVVTCVPVHKLYEIIKEISLSPQITNNIKIDLTYRDGLLIYSNYNRKGILKEKLADQEVLKRVSDGEQSGIIKAHKDNGKEKTIGVFFVGRGYLDFKGNEWVLVLHLPTSIIYDPVYKLTYKWFFLIFPSVILAIILSIFFTYKLSSPLSILKNAVTSFGEGNLNTRVRVESNDEIGVLSNAFNLMANNLKKTTTSIKNLESEIIERKKLEEALTEAHDNLEKKVIERTSDLRKAQDQLVRSEKLAAIGQLASSVAHELRNPLNIMKNVLYYLKMMKIIKDNKEIQDNLDIISSEIERSNKIISDLLGFSKIKQPFLINQNINLIIIEMLKKITKAPNIKIITQLDKNLPEFPVDQLQLQQVFNNLSLNAIQAMENGGTLTIKTMMENNSIKIIFTDTGIGIPEENMDKIFEPLFSTKAYGTGFGLSIVKLLVEKHNGKIEVESKVGKGAKFLITLPTKIPS